MTEWLCANSWWLGILAVPIALACIALAAYFTGSGAFKTADLVKYLHNKVQYGYPTIYDKLTLAAIGLVGFILICIIGLFPKDIGELVLFVSCIVVVMVIGVTAMILGDTYVVKPIASKIPYKVRSLPKRVGDAVFPWMIGIFFGIVAILLINQLYEWLVLKICTAGV